LLDGAVGLLLPLLQPRARRIRLSTNRVVLFTVLSLKAVPTIRGSKDWLN